MLGSAELVFVVEDTELANAATGLEQGSEVATSLFLFPAPPLTVSALVAVSSSAA
jgi:hypothetical protein